MRSLESARTRWTLDRVRALPHSGSTVAVSLHVRRDKPVEKHGSGWYGITVSDGAEVDKTHWLMFTTHLPTFFVHTEYFVFHHLTPMSRHCG